MAAEYLRGRRYQGRGSLEYLSILFPDDPTGNRFLNWVIRMRIENFHGTEFKHLTQNSNGGYDYEVVKTADVKEFSGGTDRFFDKKGMVLDLGCGNGKALFDFAQVRRGLKTVGFDGDFPKISPFTFPGCNYVGGNWHELPFRDGIFTSVLGCESYPRYDFRLGDDGSVVREVTRVCQAGAIWRASFSQASGLIAALRGLGGMQNEGEQMDERLRFGKHLADAGWDVYLGTRMFVAELLVKR